MKVIRCNYCSSIFSKPRPMICPVCGNAIRCWQDIDFETEDLNPEQLVDLWLLFGDIPINDADEIEEDFIGFDAGTNRFEIWHWFDERYPGGVKEIIADSANV